MAKRKIDAKEEGNEVEPPLAMAAKTSATLSRTRVSRREITSVSAPVVTSASSSSMQCIPHDTKGTIPSERVSAETAEVPEGQWVSAEDFALLQAHKRGNVRVESPREVVLMTEPEMLTELNCPGLVKFRSYLQMLRAFNVKYNRTSLIEESIQMTIDFVIGQKLPEWRNVADDVFFQALFSAIGLKTDIDYALRAIKLECNPESSEAVHAYVDEIIKLFVSRNISLEQLGMEENKRLTRCLHESLWDDADNYSHINYADYMKRQMEASPGRPKNLAAYLSRLKKVSQELEMSLSIAKIFGMTRPN